MSEKEYVSNPYTCLCKIYKYLQSFIGDSVVTCLKIIETVANLLNKAKYFIFYHILPYCNNNYSNDKVKDIDIYNIVNQAR